MRKIATIICLMAISLVQAQKVKFKKNVIYFDGKECLKYDKIDSNNIEISNTDDTQHIFLKYIRTAGGLYTKVTFVEQKKSLTSRSYIFNKKNLVKKLIKTKVIKDCSFVISKIEKFILLYDEGIEESLIRQ